MPLGTQQNAIAIHYLLSEETLAHERRYIQLHDRNLIIVYKYKDMDVFIYQMYIDKKGNRKPLADITRKKLTEESMKAFSPS